MWTSSCGVRLLDVLDRQTTGVRRRWLEKADQARARLAPPARALAPRSYADDAIVVDDLSLSQAIRSSLHVLLRHPSARSA